MIRPFIYFIIFVSLLFSGQAVAAELKLSNGNVLTGEIIKFDQRSIHLKHGVLGVIIIPLKNIANRAELEPILKKLPKPKLDTRVRGTVSTKLNASLAATLAHGANDYQWFKGSFSFNRNALWIDEWTFSLSAEKNVEQGTRVVQKLYSNLRYGISLTQSLYGFARIAGEHDPVANVDLRLVGTGGLGYWFADRKKIKLMVETGAGYKRNYFIDDATDDDFIFQLRFFMKFYFSDKHFISCNGYFFPAANSVTNYMVTANLFYNVKVSHKLALKVGYDLEYNTAPYSGAKKYDGKFYTGLEWSI